MSDSLLIELLTEELPPKALAKLGEAFAEGLRAGLQSRDLLDAQTRHTPFSTPRRLAVVIEGVRAVAPDKPMREKVLPVSVAFDAQGQPTPPLHKKLAALAASTGVESIAPDSLERAQDGKAEALFYRYTARGATLAEGLQAALDETLGKLPIPKVMTYQRPDGANVNFVRPAHRLIALHGEAIVPVTALGLRASNITRGHRFLSSGDIVVPHATAYAEVLREHGKVLAGYTERKEAIRSGLLAQANGDTVVMPESLLDEVNSLVEYPVVYACHFEEAFLQVPQECLILTMQTNQKYFALTDAAGQLRNRFLIVSNVATDTPAAIIEGNERVVRPRLADAQFFFEQDKKKPLAARVPLLDKVVYHNKLGSQGQRVTRLKRLAEDIASMLGADAALAARGAELAKADLLTDMVGEFPELQGTMGTYYARHDGEAEDVALACSEHYQPRFAGDALPTTTTGTVVALTDKLETLVGIWGIGLQPTGDKDPFALRRHALGVIRMLIEKPMPLSIPELLAKAEATFEGIAAYRSSIAEVRDFINDRLRGYLKDKGYSTQQVDAVTSLELTQLDDVVQRLDAVQAFSALPEAEALAAANKRITNILRKHEGAVANIQPTLLQEAAERTLHDAVERVRPTVESALAGGDFKAALLALAQLRGAVDSFFNDVMVMAEDPALRANRVALLSSLHALMNRVADLSKLAG